MKAKQIISLCVVLLISLDVLHAQTDSETAKRDKFVTKLQDSFSKKKFIEGLEKINNTTILVVKRIKIDGRFSNDNDLISKYNSGQNAFNEVINKMNKDINDVTNIIDYATFNAKDRYKEDLDKAEVLIKDFSNAAEVKLAGGEMASGLGEFISKFLGTLFPAFKAAEQTYLAIAKQLMGIKLDNAKLPNWSDISAK